MRPFTTKKLICLFWVLALSVPVEALAAEPVKVQRKPRKKVLPEAMVITAGGPPGAQGFDPSPIITNMEARLSVRWKGMSVGASKFCEIHFFIMADGTYRTPTVWHSSGDEALDRVAIMCVDESAPFGPFQGQGVDRLPCVATFHREPKGADVTVTMPGFMGNNSMVDKQIAAKHTQQMNIIKIMTARIASAQKVLGPNSPKLTVSINFLANTYKEVHDYKNAEGAYKWAISIREKANGLNSKELAESVSDLGDLYTTKGDYGSAEECYKRVLGMNLQPCVELRTAVQRYAKLCLKTDRRKDADLLFKRVTDMQSGKPLDPLPDNMIFNASKPQGGAPNDGTASDTKSGDKPAAAADKGTTPTDKGTAPSDKPAASSEQPSDLTPKPTDNKDDNKKVGGEFDSSGTTTTSQVKAGDPRLLHQTNK